MVAWHPYNELDVTPYGVASKQAKGSWSRSDGRGVDVYPGSEKFWREEEPVE